MNITFEEEQLLKGIKNLNKSEVIKRIASLQTDIEELKEIKESLLVKLNKCSQSELEDLLMKIE